MSALLKNNILETVGNTPIIRLNRLAPPGVELYVKVEAFNPMGSVKDRLALGVIEAAEQSGALQPGQTVIEATSGNTGIGLAMVCAQKGYPLVIVMAENFSVERRKLMRFLGAKVILTPAAEKGTGMLNKARELAGQHGWFLCRQFENEANADIHTRTTAREILAAFADRKLDYWVTGYGTGGTLKGVARVLKKESAHTRVVVCEPDNSALLSSGSAQTANPDGTPAASHTAFRPHLMQGWTPDFISRLVADASLAGLIDQVLPVSGEQSLEVAKQLAQQEGILAGITSGATLLGALQIAARAPAGSTILCMLPDTGERYLSTVLFEDIAADMSAAELSISQSTANYRFDVRPAAAPQQAAVPEAAGEDAEAVSYLQQALHDPEQPVVMFALQWCEFCWSVRKLFKECGIAYRSVDIDAVQMQENNIGARVRKELSALTACPTIPQIFVGGEFIGGCTDLFEEFKSGRLQQRLEQSGTACEVPDGFNPYALLPTWLHAR